MSSDSAKLELPDTELVRRTLSSPPFLSVDGVINFRDVGMLSLPSGSSPVSDTNEKFELRENIPRIRPGVIYRSGELARLTEKGKATLKDLGITTVFDLRSDVEIRKYQSATPKIDGVRFVHVPVSNSDEYDPMALANTVSKFAADEKSAFASLYSGMLKNGGPAYETILKHLRDKPGEPCLVHCTAGKDRTGIFAAIVQLLLGAPDAAIAHDYHLTTYGLAPVLPALVARFQKETIYRDNWKGFQNMGSAKMETMLATLRLIRETYGSAEGYLKARTSLTDADIAQIRRNLLADAPMSSSHSYPIETFSVSSALEDSDSTARFVSDRRRDGLQRVQGATGMLLAVLTGLFVYARSMFGWIWRAVL